MTQKKGLHPSDFRQLGQFGQRYPFESLNQRFDDSTNGDGPADIISQTAECVFGCHFFFALAQEVSNPIIMLDRSKGMLAGLLALLLFGNVPADKNHNALFGSAHFAEVVQIFAAHAVDRDLLERVLA